MTESSGIVWRKAKRSSDNYGQCVELAVLAGVIGIRDSKQRGTGPVLEFSRQEMAVFLRSVKAGNMNRA